ncbi:hypothetical protein M9458_010875, partial [Cirrhinus mrigala]
TALSVWSACPARLVMRSQLSALSLSSPWANLQNVVTLSTRSACWPCTTMEP